MITINKHSLEILETLISIYPDTKSVIISLLFFSSVKDNLKLTHIKHHFDEEIAEIFFSLDKLFRIQNTYYNTTQETLQLFLSLNPHLIIRVLLIRFAYLLHKLRFNCTISDIEYYLMSEEIKDIYVSLFQEITLEKINNALQNVCLEILHPQLYKFITNFLKEHYPNPNQSVIKVINSCHDILSRLNLAYTISGRVKSLYSIAQKLVNKSNVINNLCDIIGIRVIVEQDNECYKVLNTIFNYYAHVSNKNKDFIKFPKKNNYQSLHAIIIDKDSRKLEVQIRTKRMHHIAQSGSASHLQYKTNLHNSNNLVIVYNILNKFIFNTLNQYNTIPSIVPKYLRINKLDVLISYIIGPTKPSNRILKQDIYIYHKHNTTSSIQMKSDYELNYINNNVLIDVIIQNGQNTYNHIRNLSKALKLRCDQECKKKDKLFCTEVNFYLQNDSDNTHFSSDVPNSQSSISQQRISADIPNSQSSISQQRISADVPNSQSSISQQRISADIPNSQSSISQQQRISADIPNSQSSISQQQRISADVPNSQSSISQQRISADIPNSQSSISQQQRISADVPNSQSSISQQRISADIPNSQSSISQQRISADVPNSQSSISQQRISADVPNSQSSISQQRISADIPNSQSSISQQKNCINTITIQLISDHDTMNILMKELMIILKDMNITHLDLSNNNIGDKEIKILTPMLKDTQITYLDLSYNYINDIGVRELAEILSNIHIIYLNLSSNIINDTGILEITAILKNSRITHLDLSNNNIGNTRADDSMETLAAILPYTNITHLDLGHNSIDSAGIIALAKILRDTKITYLNLDYNAIGTYGISVLAETVKGTNIIIHLKEQQTYNETNYYDSHFSKLQRIEFLQLDPSLVQERANSEFNNTPENKESDLGYETWDSESNNTSDTDNDSTLTIDNSNIYDGNSTMNIRIGYRNEDVNINTIKSCVSEINKTPSNISRLEKFVDNFPYIKVISNTQVLTEYIDCTGDVEVTTVC